MYSIDELENNEIFILLVYDCESENIQHCEGHNDRTRNIAQSGKECREYLVCLAWNENYFI